MKEVRGALILAMPDLWTSNSAEAYETACTLLRFGNSQLRRPLLHQLRLGSGNPESASVGSHFLLTMGVRANQL